MNEEKMTGKCTPQETFLENVRLARAYVPFQIMCASFSPASSLTKGTIFPSLWDNYSRDMKGQRVIDDD